MSSEKIEVQIASATEPLTEAEGGNNDITTSEKIESEGSAAVASGSKDDKDISEMEIQSDPVTFVGLGKEDLLVLANRPFWVRLRWALFISFWLLWLALLVGAALIIALSPGCEKDEELSPSSASSHRR